MPLYEYRCAKCGNVFEVIQKFSDTPLTVHEACGGSVERLISLSGFSLKGSGWYATDYAKSGTSSQKKDSDKKDANTKAESKSTDSKPAETKSSESKTESKPGASTTIKTD
jgi:putative FmdB family regulatory protein